MPKADKFGTVTEQIRYQAGWKTASAAKGDRRRCRECFSFFPEHAQGRHFCVHMGCVTTPLAKCNHWITGLPVFKKEAQS